MTVHAEFLELISASIDFDLTEEERGRLNLHLSQCAACRRAGLEIRSVAADVAAAPRPRLSPARSEAILAAALRRPASRPRWGLLAVAAMLLALGGGAVAALGLFDDEPAPSVRPSPTAVAQATGSPSVPPRESPSVAPGGPVAPEPSPTPTAVASPTPGGGLTFPLPWSFDNGPVRIAPNADDSAWISFDDGDRLTVLALLDADGVPAPGWPIEIPFAEDCVPYAMSDGSVRLACAYSEADEDCADACGDDRVFAWDAAARPLAGWPVRFEPGLSITIDRHGARVLGTDLVLSRFEGDDEFEDEVGLMGMAQLLRLAADGTVRPGTGVRTSQWCCAIGPDGRGYARNVVHAEDGAQTTTLTAFDESGPVAGWPIELPGDVSLPSFGPNGLLYMTSWSATEESSLLVRGADGRDVPGVGDRRIEGSVTWDPRWFAPLAPEVDDAGRAYVLFDDRALAFDATLAPLPGWPYRPSTGFVVAGECPPGDTGCQPYTVPPTVNGAGVLYLLETSGGSGAGRITAVNRDGTVRSGWPVTLRRPGAEFQSVTLAPSGIAFAVALEPEPGEGHSVTILAIARNSTVLWTRTIGEP